MRIPLLFALFVAIVAPAPVLGQVAGDSALRPLLTSNENRGWEAVGRLNIAGRTMCTGALISPDLVLTAAHCLYDPESHQRVAPTSIDFLAGWRNGRASAVGKVKRALVLPEYVYDPVNPARRVPNDIAILQLAEPILKSSIKPFQTGDRPAKWDRVEVVSYGRNRAQSPSLQDSCHVLAHQGGTMILSCSVDFGSSGAPVFVVKNGIAKIVSVISAKAQMGSGQVSLAAALDRPLARLMAVLGKDTGARAVAAGIPVMRRLPRQRAGGAKFLRP